MSPNRGFLEQLVQFERELGRVWLTRRSKKVMPQGLKDPRTNLGPSRVTQYWPQELNFWDLMQKRKKWTLWSLEKYRLHLPDADISLKLRVYCMTQQEELENSWYCRNMAGGPLTDEELAKACRSRMTVLAIFIQGIYKQTDSWYLTIEKITCEL